MQTEPKKKTPLFKIGLISFIVWIVSICLFLGFSALFYPSTKINGGVYTASQDMGFMAVIGLGIIAFLVFISTVLLKFLHKIKSAPKFSLSGILKTIGIIMIILVVALWIWGNLKKDQPNISNPGSKVTCIRTEPYKLAPEFDRALSLIEQRESAYYPDKSNAVSSIRNCLDIEYADTGEAEGMFYFDDSVSSLDRLVIKVNPSYKETDDLLTALLLRHELEHAGSYITLKKYGTTESCIQGEVGAFRWQYEFYRSLTVEERKSIVSRLVYGKATNTKINAQIQILDDLAVYYNQAVKECASKATEDQWDLWACYSASFTGKITKYVESNPFYQKQCGL